jgi:hypothetical protein
MYRQTDGQMDRQPFWTDKHIDRQTDGQTNRWTEKHIDRQTDGQTTHEQKNRQIERYR